MKYLFVIALCVLGAQALPSTFIINGNDATDVVPYHVHIHIDRNGDESVFIGSGVLIRPNIVLTVAQNVYGFNRWECGMGAININELHWIDVDITVFHSDYDPSTLSNNIALLRLVSNVVAPAAPVGGFLSDPLQPPTDALGTLSGWGFTSWPPTPTNPTPTIPDILKIAHQTIIDQNNCATEYPHLVAEGTLGQHFCAYNATGFNGFCGGDQGGGFVAPMFGLNMLLGLKSFIRELDCSFDAPNAYVRTSFFTTWINTNANNMVATPTLN